LTAPPPFTKQVTVDGVTRTVRDGDAARAWQARYLAMVESVLAAPDASFFARANAYSHLLGHYARTWRDRIKTPEGQEVLRKAEALYAGMEREFRHNPSMINGATALAGLLDAADPERCQVFLRKLLAEYTGAGRPDTAVREMATGRLKLLVGQAHPVWLALQTLEGEHITSRDYEGKIVLLTLAPLTYAGVIDVLKRVTATYRARGVEIVHVSTGRNNDRSAAALTREELQAYASEQGVTWRVVFDGNDLLGKTTRSLGLNYMPAYILLSRDHRFVAETPSSYQLTKAIDIELSLDGKSAPPVKK
ncbi:MAG TPA: TlpA disulfide reductase family protein, partial [Opitutaceae bacterium]